MKVKVNFCEINPKNLDYSTNTILKAKLNM